MPIVDIEFVGSAAPRPDAQRLADALGRALATPAGTTWVRVRELPRANYAENESALADDELPVFMTVLHAHLSEGAARKTEVELLTLTLATALDISPTRVHIQYAAAGAGRQAFGGQLVK